MESEFERQGNEILAKYDKTEWRVDINFFGADAVYGKAGSGNDYGIKWWERIKNMYDNDGSKIVKPVVISQGLGANDIGQGGIGDWRFLSALSVVAYNRPDLLK